MYMQSVPARTRISWSTQSLRVPAMSQSFSLTRLAGLLAGFIAALVMVTDIADAKVGGGSSVGSRGARTYTPPAATNTAPKTAAPMERSATQPGANNPGATAATAASARPSMFGGFRGLLLGGLMAGALASIFGVGAFASALGFILQAALIGGLVFLVVNFFRNRNGGAPALASARPGNAANQRPINVNAYRSGVAGASGTAAALAITPDDFSAFEKLLSDIQLAYGRGDVNALGDRVTPEMLSYFAGDLDTNAKKGVRNEISSPTLLQGDLSEAWREGQTEYATVAMRFSLLDRMVDIASGRVVSGSATVPSESTEVWTFRRPLNGKPRDWELSAIQQA